MQGRGRQGRPLGDRHARGASRTDHARTSCASKCQEKGIEERVYPFNGVTSDHEAEQDAEVGRLTMRKEEGRKERRHALNRGGHWNRRKGDASSAIEESGGLRASAQNTPSVTD